MRHRRPRGAPPRAKIPRHAASPQRYTQQREATTDEKSGTQKQQQQRGECEDGVVVVVVGGGGGGRRDGRREQRHGGVHLRVHGGAVRVPRRRPPPRGEQVGQRVHHRPPHRTS